MRVRSPASDFLSHRSRQRRWTHPVPLGSRSGWTPTGPQRRRCRLRRCWSTHNCHDSPSRVRAPVLDGRHSRWCRPIGRRRRRVVMGAAPQHVGESSSDVSSANGRRLSGSAVTPAPAAGCRQATGPMAIPSESRPGAWCWITVVDGAYRAVSGRPSATQCSPGGWPPSLVTKSMDAVRASVGVIAAPR